jgi:hypothetical protein
MSNVSPGHNHRSRSGLRLSCKGSACTAGYQEMTRTGARVAMVLWLQRSIRRARRGSSRICPKTGVATRALGYCLRYSLVISNGPVGSPLSHSHKPLSHSRTNGPVCETASANSDTLQRHDRGDRPRLHSRSQHTHRIRIPRTGGVRHDTRGKTTAPTQTGAVVPHTTEINPRAWCSGGSDLRACSAPGSGGERDDAAVRVCDPVSRWARISR